MDSAKHLEFPVKLIAVIPVWNEAGNVLRVLDGLRNLEPQYSIYSIWVDDGSTDGTPQILHDALKPDEGVVLSKVGPRGPGASFAQGLSYALQEYPNIALVLTMEGDMTSDPALIPQMVERAMGASDLVLASVYHPQGGFVRTSAWRMGVSGIANALLRWRFGLKVHTLSSFFRVYRTSLLRRVQQHYGVLIRETGYTSMPELLIKCARCGAKISEVPFTLDTGLRHGASKMRVFRTTLRYLRLVLRPPF